MVPSSDSRPRTIVRRAIVLVALGAVYVCITGAADAPAAGVIANGKLAGLFSGLVLLGLTLYALWLFAEPLLNDPQAGIGSALLILLAIWVAKTSLLPLFPGFGPDVGSYQAWADRIASLGPAFTYQKGYFIDYPPGYLYALWAAGLVAKLAGASGVSTRVIVQSPALIADLLLAATVFVYLRGAGYLRGSYLGMLLIALNPMMLYNSVVWGQSDSVLTLVMLLGVLMLLREEYELAWGLAALALLIKPQALALLPVLALWTALKLDWRRWWRAAFAFVAIVIVGIAPFQVNHEWSWIFSLYASTAAYYHETSVNAFNFMALAAGLRRSDSDTVLGISAFALGMSLLIPFYLFVGWTLWKRQTSRALFYASFLTIFGFFMLAPRMHERYLYPALAFLVILAIDEPAMLALFGVLSLTCLFNLAYVKHALETPSIVFLDGRDLLAMLTSAINLIGFALALALYAGHVEGAPEAAPPIAWLGAWFARLRHAAGASETSPPDELEPALPPLPWIRTDTFILIALLIGAACVRFWKLGRPPDIVFDEVHFVAQARHYLRSEPFLDPHPPLAKLVIAVGIMLFGDHPWSWRCGNALIGTALVGLTYLIGLKMFRSRLAASLTALCIACDGMFIVDSRIAVIDIVYVTMAALSYYILFCFIDQRGNPAARRHTLLWLGIALGLCVGSKLYIPIVTFGLVLGFMLYVIWDESRRERLPGPAIGRKRLIGATVLVSAVSAFVYLVVFLPHFILGWWGGIADVFHYYNDVVWYEQSVSSATHPYSAPWWSWPLMLRPVAYWQDFPKTGDVATIWGGGNPVLWWGALAAIMVNLGRSLERRTLVRSFIVISYVSYLAIWIPIGRTIFLYHYLPAIYIGYLALGGLLAEFWEGRAQMLEEISVMLTLFPCAILGLGYTVGAFAFLGLAVAYFAVIERPRWPGRVVFAAFTGSALAASVYFFPVWVAMPIARAGYYARMWLQGPGLRNWI